MWIVANITSFSAHFRTYLYKSRLKRVKTREIVGKIERFGARQTFELLRIMREVLNSRFRDLTIAVLHTITKGKTATAV